tara:strand:+ start:384 stop:794 length:411 start_codon:yes stop_codon:yes gene_type:complete
MRFKQHIIILLAVIVFASCNMHITIDASKKKENFKREKNKISILLEEKKEKKYKGWWVYGEGQHIFKDEETLNEYDITFINENINEINDLYLAVCEMEYFPMECTMTGKTKTDVLAKKKTLIVSNFEILYIQGCGE